MCVDTMTVSTPETPRFSSLQFPAFPRSSKYAAVRKPFVEQQAVGGDLAASGFFESAIMQETEQEDVNMELKDGKHIEGDGQSVHRNEEVFTSPKVLTLSYSRYKPLELNRHHSVLEKASVMTLCPPSSTAFRHSTPPCRASGHGSWADCTNDVAGTSQRCNSDSAVQYTPSLSSQQQSFVSNDSALQNFPSCCTSTGFLGMYPEGYETSRNCRNDFFPDVSYAPRLPLSPELSSDTDRPMVSYQPHPVFSPVGAAEGGPLSIRLRLPRNNVVARSSLNENHATNDDSVYIPFVRTGCPPSSCSIEDSCAELETNEMNLPPPMPMMNTPELVVRRTIPDYRVLKMRRMGCPPPCLDFPA